MTEKTDARVAVFSTMHACSQTMMSQAPFEIDFVF